jgi:cytochrome c oxidase cbb3-type subunit III
MKSSHVRVTAVLACMALVSIAGRGIAQNAEPAHGETPQPGTFRGPRVAAYPVTKSTDPEAVARGRTLYMTTFGCGKCHAADLRGTDTGVSLLHSMAVMEDANGELIATAVGMMPSHGGRYSDITEAQYSDIAQYTKSIPNIGTGGVQILTPSIFHAGDPAEGQKYFVANCAGCHAVKRGESSKGANLAGIGAGTPTSGDAARALQQRWLSPTALGHPNLHLATTAVVTTDSGEKISGKVTRLTEFAITLTPSDGPAKTITRKSESDPRIEVNYPLAGHAALMHTITDKEIHDVTGYLVTLK